MKNHRRIALSLKGNGCVVKLSPETVRRVFHQFCRGTLRTLGEMVSQLRHPWLTDRAQRLPVADRLLSSDKGRLSRDEIARLESQFNQLAIQRGWSLLDRQATCFDDSTSVAVSFDQVDRRRSAGVILNGACFAVRLISKRDLLDGGPRDVVVEDGQRNLRLLRYHDVALVGGMLCVRVSSRYDINRIRTEPLATFRPFRIGSILRAQPLPDFYFAEISPFLTGK